MAYESPINKYSLNFNSGLSGPFSPSLGGTPDLYWSNQLATYNLNRFKIEAPLMLSNYLDNLFSSIMPDYSQLFSDWANPILLSTHLKTGMTLLDSKNPTTQLLGLLMVQDSLSSENLSTLDTLVPDVSHLAGENIDYGLLFLLVGKQFAGQLVKTLPGKTGQVLGAAANAGSSIYNSISSIKEINAAEAGVEGLGEAKAGNAMAIAGAASDLVGNFLPEKTEYNGPKGDITLTMDSVYDSISNAAMSFGPVGMIVGGAMKAGSLLGKGMNALGGGTDGMTSTDAILGSSFLSLTPFGLVNGFGGKRTDTITKDELAFDAVGSSYGGTLAKVEDALTKSGKKYGLFSSSARKEANRQIAEAKRQLRIMSGIADDALERFAIRDAMSAINGNRRALAMQGGYNLSAIQFGRKGMVIAKRVASQYKMQEKRKASDPFLTYLNSLPEESRSLTKELWEQSGSPKNFGEAIAKGIFSVGDDGWVMVEEFKEGGSINKASTLFEIELLPLEFKDGGVLEPSAIKEVEIMVEEFKEGGSFNVIPEGALHARLHHMENSENITKKGIPVVSEGEGGQLEQHAEIEKEEIILRLSLTKRLEELAKEDTDESAIEAGKILVEEILNNTIDNTKILL